MPEPLVFRDLAWQSKDDKVAAVFRKYQDRLMVFDRWEGKEDDPSDPLREVFISWREKYFPGEVRFSPVGEGWADLIDKLMEDLFAMGWNGLLEQCKEKFGGIRWYVGSASKEIHSRISEAEIMSYLTCETCGRMGFPRQSGWIKTLCDKHATMKDGTVFPIGGFTFYLYDSERKSVGALRLIEKEDLEDEKNTRDQMRAVRASYDGNSLTMEASSP